MKKHPHLKSIDSQEDYENQLAGMSRKCKIIQKVPENSIEARCQHQKQIV